MKSMRVKFGSANIIFNFKLANFFIIFVHLSIIECKDMYITTPPIGAVEKFFKKIKKSFYYIY